MATNKKLIDIYYTENMTTTDRRLIHRITLQQLIDVYYIGQQDNDSYTHIAHDNKATPYRNLLH